MFDAINDMSNTWSRLSTLLHLYNLGPSKPPGVRCIILSIHQWKSVSSILVIITTGEEGGIININNQPSN